MYGHLGRAPAREGGGLRVAFAQDVLKLNHPIVRPQVI